MGINDYSNILLTPGFQRNILEDEIGIRSPLSRYRAGIYTCSEEITTIVKRES
ncbi:hypothetical protein KSZ_01480 [Dictyobacter formicarum]|uniref:Uncharacterized protein n=1 Tax=Dictyobacter formicarum TaxID=2778368 RepID=A0ABQ3V7M5_9CHLR|nr:hypothetical protein KSZ_01480 [Dictyobacter formicarum]